MQVVSSFIKSFSHSDCFTKFMQEALINNMCWFLTSLSPCLRPQLCSRTEGLHEERKPGSFLPGETNDSEPFFTSGDIPAQASAEDPQIPPAATGTSSNTACSTSNTSATTDITHQIRHDGDEDDDVFEGCQ